MITIYKLTAPNGKSYVGQTGNLQHRFLQYKGMWCKDQPKLYNSLKKYKWDNFTKEILECIPDEFADEYERMYIKLFECCETGLNLDSGGCANKIMSDSSKLKMSLAHKGTPCTAETRLKLSIVQKGRKLTNEHKLKISYTKKGHKHTDETKLKLSLANKGHIHTDATKLKMIGRKCTDAAKLKMRIAKKNMSDETKHKMSVAKKAYHIQQRLKLKTLDI